jgi:hypothetical protein
MKFKKACGPGETYDFPVKGCICLKAGDSIRCPVPPRQQCKNFRLDECNMCTCDENHNKKSFICTLKWCTWETFFKKNKKIFIHIYFVWVIHVKMFIHEKIRTFVSIKIIYIHSTSLCFIIIFNQRVCREMLIFFTLIIDDCLSVQ